MNIDVDSETGKKDGQYRVNTAKNRGKTKKLTDIISCFLVCMGQYPGGAVIINC